MGVAEPFRGLADFRGYAMRMNVLIAQSGGPSPVINNTLRGIIDACQSFPDTFGTLYGAWHGIGYFFYVGGNDSMDTAVKVAKLARSKGVAW